jgi:hypothetical protein
MYILNHLVYLKNIKKYTTGYFDFYLKKTKNTVPKILSISNKKILSVHKYLKKFFLNNIHSVGNSMLIGERLEKN